MRSILFHGLLYFVMAVMGVVGAPFVLWREDWTRAWQKAFNRVVFRMLRTLFGVRVEIRGAAPLGDVLIAAKHQSMLDVLILYNALPRARFVMKRALLWMPVFGLYAWRTGAVAIDRKTRHGGAEDLVRAFANAPGQIVIYPQGTRTAPGNYIPYKRGIARLAEATGRPIVTVATNTGLFWKRGGAMSGPGAAIIAFGEVIDPHDLTRKDLMREIETRIEAESDALVAEVRSKRV
ncbi:1-acyl-sn-glycerol-3-phosphate acyltransferase [Rhodobacteraceae bacterium NNCM2]|nr:1-acyl-sn-glycerol-3-phosphate acyltransferase [Coraliihabitans acroporae]